VFIIYSISLQANTLLFQLYPVSPTESPRRREEHRLQAVKGIHDTTVATRLETAWRTTDWPPA